MRHSINDTGSGLKDCDHDKAVARKEFHQEEAVNWFPGAAPTLELDRTAYESAAGDLVSAAVLDRIPDEPPKDDSGKTTPESGFLFMAAKE